MYRRRRNLPSGRQVLPGCGFHPAGQPL